MDAERIRIMSPTHPRWSEFAARLRELQPARCDHTFQRTRRVLEEIEGADVEKSLEYFESEGGFCDCEVILNVVVPAEGKQGA